MTDFIDLVTEMRFALAAASMAYGKDDHLAACRQAERIAELAERLAAFEWSEHENRCDRAGVSPYDATVTP